MPLQTDIVDEGIMFSGCPSATFIYLDRSYYHDVSWMASAISMNIH